MRISPRKTITIIVAALWVATFVVAGSTPLWKYMGVEQTNSEDNTKPNRTKKDPQYVDMRSNAGQQTEHNGEKIYIATGNFAAHHNGAVITCDSAVRHPNNLLECYGNVLINKGTTYIYGDKAEYNNETNEARVYSEIVKVVDKDATLYTFNFLYNTKTNIGEYHGGGTATNKGEDELESTDGYYYGDAKQLICVGNVQMRNDTYSMIGDSVVYNTDTGYAQFFENTNIWNEQKNEYLYGDCGEFVKDSARYTITKNGYILTADAEAYADTMDYYRDRGYVLMRNNIQLDNAKDKVLAFGNWGEYWRNEGNAFLTKNPAMVSYDTTQSDSVFVRADSMYLYTKDPVAERLAKQKADSLTSIINQTAEANEEQKSEKSENNQNAADKQPQKKTVNSNNDSAEQTAPDQEDGQINPTDTATMDTPQADTSVVDSLPKVDTLTKAQKKALLKEELKKKKAEENRIKADSLRAKLDRIADQRQAKKSAILRRMEMQDSLRNARIKERNEKKTAERLRKSLAKMAKKGLKMKPIDGSKLAIIDSIILGEFNHTDSIVNYSLDSLIDSLHLFWGIVPDSLADTMAVDSTYRLIQAIRNVKMFRTDFQAVCDSLEGTTIDSIIHLHKSPVLWNDRNQITSEVMHVIFKNGKIHQAEFEGRPMTVAEIDTIHYNQVVGKTMTAFFENNQIYRNDVNGNVQTIYYMQDEKDSTQVTMMAYIESGDMSSYITNRKLTGITYRGEPTYTFYPMDKIPETQPMRLEGFSWEGARRPSRDSVFKWSIRPSQREWKEGLIHPTFPIAERVNRRKIQLQKMNMWYDRTDVLSQEIVEWVESVK